VLPGRFWLSSVLLFATVGLLMTFLSTGCRHIRTANLRPKARLVGTLWWRSPNDLNRPISAWRTELDQLEALGIPTLVLNRPFVDESPAPGAADPVEGLFAEADRRGLSIYLDTCPHQTGGRCPIRPRKLPGPVPASQLLRAAMESIQPSPVGTFPTKRM